MQIDDKRAGALDLRVHLITDQRLRAAGAAVVTDVKRWFSGARAAADILHVGHGYGPVHHFHQGAQWS